MDAVTADAFPELSPAEATREIEAHLASRSPEPESSAAARRIRRALALLGDPHRSLETIVVSGTEGAASTSRMIESLVRAHGLRTGLSLEARRGAPSAAIVIDGAELPAEALVPLWMRVAPAIHSVDRASQVHGGSRMSSVEVGTVLGLVACADADIDALIVEAGSGGRQDTTAGADARVAVITPVAAALGCGVAGDPSGIARGAVGSLARGGAVVSARQHDEVARALASHAAARFAAVFWEGAHLSVAGRRPVPSGQVATLRTASRNYLDVFVPRHGESEARNALLALAAAEAFLGGGVPRSLHLPAVARGFADGAVSGPIAVDDAAAAGDVAS